MVLKFPRARSGPKERIGFIEAPDIGAAHKPASSMYPPNAIAALEPMFRAPDAVPRIVFTNPVVKTISIASAVKLPTQSIQVQLQPFPVLLLLYSHVFTFTEL